MWLRFLYLGDCSDLEIWSISESDHQIYSWINDETALFNDDWPLYNERGVIYMFMFVGQGLTCDNGNVNDIKICYLIWFKFD